MSTITTYDHKTKTTTVRDMTADESQELEASRVDDLWHQLRTTRNTKLAESDWTVLTDSPVSTAAWKTYRQALRDLPANTTDPSNPVWPTPPS